MLLPFILRHLSLAAGTWDVPGCSIFPHLSISLFWGWEWERSSCGHPTLSAQTIKYISP